MGRAEPRRRKNVQGGEEEECPGRRGWMRRKEREECRKQSGMP